MPQVVNPIRFSTLANGLIGHWPLDDANTNGTANDLSPESRDLTKINTPTSVTGPGGSLTEAREFIASSNERFETAYANISDVYDFRTADTFSFSMYAWFDVAANGDTLLSLYDSTSVRTWRVQRTIGEQIRMQGYTSDGSPSTLTSNDTISIDTWHHIVITWDAGSCGCIIDDGTPKVVGGKTIGASTGSPSFRVGYNNFDGRLCDVRIYDRVITASEITALYNLGIT